MNAYLNTKTNVKKLQYGVEKCYKMHVGRYCHTEICPDLHVDGWKLETVTDVVTGHTDETEEFSGMHEMKEVKTEKYLGDIISHDGKNVKNIIARKSKGTGIMNQIMTKLEEVSFGSHYFEVAILWRSTYLISSLLTNAEAWFNLSKGDVDSL